MFSCRFHVFLFWISLWCIHEGLRWYCQFQKALFNMNGLSYELLYECSCWLIWCYIMLLIEWWLIMDYIVESLLCCCCRCRWCCQVVEVVHWCCISCWVHAYSCKVGGSCPVECLIIQTTLILRAYALHVDLGVDAPHVVLRAIALHVEMRAYALTRWLVLHAYCIAKLLLCHCIVVVVELI